jgi:ferric-dicitrate binding protein FerR (iron transport regulator)
MFSRHVVQRLTAYVHGECSVDELRRVEQHVAECAKCRAAYEDVRFAAKLASMLTVSPAPVHLPQIRESLPRPQRPAYRRLAPIALALTAIVLAIALWNRPPGPAWDVGGLPGTEQLRPGDVLETNTSSAEIAIADIGRMTVEPNSRIRLLVTQKDQHRIALDRGRLEAFTWSPPRLFVVETPLANAVDLGCKYSLEVEQDGSSLLHVTLGLVALEREGRETIDPAGAF